MYRNQIKIMKIINEVKTDAYKWVESYVMYSLPLPIFANY